MASACRKSLLPDVAYQWYLSTTKNACSFDRHLHDSISVGHAHISSGKFADFSRHVQNKTTEDSSKLFAGEHVIRELHANTSNGGLYPFSDEERKGPSNATLVLMVFRNGFCDILCGYGPLGDDLIGSPSGDKNAHEVRNVTYTNSFVNYFLHLSLGNKPPTVLKCLRNFDSRRR